MKFEKNDKYKSIAIYSFIVISSAILFYLILSGLEGFFNALSDYFGVLYPFIYGFVIAYLVNFVFNFYKRTILKIPKVKKIPKKGLNIVSLILAYLTSAFFIFLFFAFVLPQVVTSLTGLVQKLPIYVRDTSKYLEDLSKDIHLTPDVANFLNDRWDELGVTLTEQSKDIIPYILSFLLSTAFSIWNLLLGIIISIYMLADKDRFITVSKKLVYAIFSEKIADKTIALQRRTQKIFSDFLGGKMLDSLIVGIIAFIVFSIVDMPYTILITFIITITNIVPFFGPFIGAIPSVIIVFFESPVMAFWFLVIILALQQLDGNVIGPKILGNSLGISSFWILFAILVGGKFFGVIGLIIGVPLFVLIYSIIKELIEYKLDQKGLPIKTDAYKDK